MSTERANISTCSQTNIAPKTLDLMSEKKAE